MWDAIVIGAGVCGCAAARELARYRLKVLVLEKGSDVCAGTSKGNSACVHAGYDPDPGSNKALYNVAGNALFDDLCDELHIPFRRTGTIVCAYSEEEMGTIRNLHENGKKNGVPTEIRDAEGLREIEPYISEGVIGGLWAPTGGVVCPYTLVIAMAESAAINGVEFKTETPVTDIRFEDGVYKVFSGETCFVTKTVVNCAGTHADEMNNFVSEHKIRIIPRQGEHILLDRRYQDYAMVSVDEVPRPLPGGGHTKGMGELTTMDGTIVVGCNTREVEDKDDCRITREGIDDIIETTLSGWPRFPFETRAGKFPFDAIIGSFTGVRAHPEGDDFIIGEVDDAPGFYNAAGIESPGLTAGPAIGVELCRLVVNYLSAEKKETFIKGRPWKKPFRIMTDEERMEAIKSDADYARIVCRCELVTEAEIRDAIRRPLGAKTINAVKMRTRAGMGRCQGGFCSGRVLQILAEELKKDPLEIELAGKGSYILAREACCESLTGGVR